MKRISGTKETGRTMLEIFGVVVLIGLLSIVAILGFRYAWYVWQENETLDTINKVAAGAKTGELEKQAEAGNEHKRIKASYFISEANVKSDGYTIETPLKTDIDVWVANEAAFEIGIQNITYSACSRLLSASANYQSARLADKAVQDIGVYASDSKEEKDAFCREVDAFNRTASAPGARVNPDANIVLCFSDDVKDCQLPGRINTPCGPGVEHGDKVGDCGVCDNGNIVQNDDIALGTCDLCDVTTSYLKQVKADCCHEDEECKGKCERCEGNRCIAKIGYVTQYDLNPDTCKCDKTEESYCIYDEEPPETRTCSIPETPLPCPENKCCRIGGKDACGRDVWEIEACVCSEGYSTSACGSGQYEVATETLADGTVCRRCEGCPSGNTCPAGACCTETVTPANPTTGCPAYMTYTTTSCVCSEGYSTSACGSGQYEVATETLADGTVCRKCEGCPTPATCPANSCCKLDGPADACGKPTARTQAMTSYTYQEKNTNGCCVNKTGTYCSLTRTQPTHAACSASVSNVCKHCNGDGTLGNETNGSHKQSDGKCCVDGSLAFSKTYCPMSCPAGYQTAACGSNQHETDKKTLTDGTVCRKCEGCPTPATCPANSCCKLDGPADACGKPTARTQAKTSYTYQEKNANGCCVSKTGNYCALTESKPTVAACSASVSNVCKHCNGDGTLGNETNGSQKQSDGKCCVNGALAHSKTYCPMSCPSGYTTAACGSGKYQTESKTLADGTVCRKCGNCPTGSDCPANSCCTSSTVTPNQTTYPGCPSYTTSTVKTCSGFCNKVNHQCDTARCEPVGAWNAILYLATVGKVAMYQSSAYPGVGLELCWADVDRINAGGKPAHPGLNSSPYF